MLAWYVFFYTKGSKMFTNCNIDKTDRINRAVIGVLIFLAALCNMSRTFFMTVGAVLFVQSFIGWCSIPYILDKFKSK